jgi:hypothetical protein
MVRLATDSGIVVNAEVNRSGFELVLRVTGDVWRSMASLGLVPDTIFGRPPTVVPPKVSQTPSVRTVPVLPDGWCDIFWWLC